jgi:hypothetical protein
MARTDFDKFVQRKKAEEEIVSAFDPKQQLNEWFQYLDALYDKAREFLSSYIQGGTARIEFREIDLNEEFSGPYTVRQLFIHIGSSTITLRPIGTMLIGSKGRVDVHGPRGTVRLVLINKDVTHARQLIRVRISVPGDPPPPPEAKSDQIEWVWKIATPPPEMSFTDLNENSFFDMILSVADA